MKKNPYNDLIENELTQVKKLMEEVTGTEPSREGAIYFSLITTSVKLLETLAAKRAGKSKRKKA